MTTMTLSGPARRRTAVIGAIVVCVSLTAAGRLGAQELYGSIVGVVKDAQGGLLPGATVVIVNRDTGLRREAITNTDGAYTFTNVQNGPHDVRIAMTGFREAVRANVPVAVGQISRVDVALEVGGFEQTVEVSAPVQLLQTDKADVRTEIKATEITNLPLNQYRNYQALINLVPGSLPGNMPNSETLLPQRSINFSVNGQAAAANTTRTDGTNLQNAFLPTHQMYIPPAETIDSVSIVAGSMDAEQGGASGAAITVTTKSGTNRFRGSGFEFFNSHKLNANPYYFGRGRGADEAAGDTAHAGWHAGRPHPPEPAVLLRRLRGLPERARRVFFPERAGWPAARRRLRRGAQHERDAAADLRSDDGKPRDRPGADRLPEQRHPRRALQPHRGEADEHLLSAAQRRGHRRRRAHEQLSRDPAGDDRAPQLRSQAQLEPDRGAPALDEDQPHGLGR